tara:strand:- start:745 stop:951 length:207 start_codon:yes stop_codon:yes gene_type:complete
MPITYKLTKTSVEETFSDGTKKTVSRPPCVVRKDDSNVSLTIPFDSDNGDYQEYLKWVAAGNTADPAD